MKRVVVLMGGIGPEREISLMSGKRVIKALQGRGHTTIGIDTQNKDWINSVYIIAPDVVFNVLHGVHGEDGAVQGVLETLGYPYTHSGVLASALAMNKDVSKVLFQASGIQVVPWIIAKNTEAAKKHLMPPPYVVKPICYGSSVGVFFVQEHDPPCSQLLASDWHYGENVMIERLICGEEITCGIFNNTILGVLHIMCPKDKFYNYHAKYTTGGSLHQVPGKQFSNEILKTIERATRIAYNKLKCKGVARADFVVDVSQNSAFLLELNTQPGMTDISLVPDMVRLMGKTYDAFIEEMLDDASCSRS